MAELMGSESKYAGSRSGAISPQGTSAKPMSTFGSAVVAPPISGPMQNLVPGSSEWVNARMAAIIEQLKAQYSDAASRRGMLQSGAAEEEFAKAVEDARTQVNLEAANYNAQIQSREDQQAHEAGLAREQNRAQEKAAMWSGIGNAAPYALFGKWGKDDSTLAGKGWDALKSGLKSPAAPGAYKQSTYANPINDPALNPVTKVKSPYTDAMESGQKYGSADEMRKAGIYGSGDTLPAEASATGRLKAGPGDGGTWGRLGMGAVGTGVGTMLASNKNKAPALMAGLASTGLGARAGMSGGANALLSGLSAGTLGSIKGNMLSGKNLWKTLIGAGSMAGSAGLFGRF